MLGSQSNKGGRGQRNSEEIGAGATTFLAASRLIIATNETAMLRRLPDNRLVVELENFYMANDSNNHLFRFTIPPTPLDSPVPLPGPYLFQSTSVQNHLLHYNPSQVVPLPFIPHQSPSES